MVNSSDFATGDATPESGVPPPSGASNLNAHLNAMLGLETDEPEAMETDVITAVNEEVDNSEHAVILITGLISEMCCAKLKDNLAFCVRKNCQSHPANMARVSVPHDTIFIRRNTASASSSLCSTSKYV